MDLSIYYLCTITNAVEVWSNTAFGPRQLLAVTRGTAACSVTVLISGRVKPLQRSLNGFSNLNNRRLPMLEHVTTPTIRSIKYCGGND